MLFYVINFLRNRPSSKAGNTIQLKRPSPMLGTLVLSLGIDCMLPLKCMGYAGSLLVLLAQSNADATNIDLNSFQKPNNKEFQIFAQQLHKDLETKQQAAVSQATASTSLTDLELTQDTPDWLRSLEQRSRNLSLNQFPNQLSSSSSSEFYIFASISLKQKHLKALIEDAKRFGGAVIIRGLKNGSFNETVKYLQSIMKQEFDGVLIDPTLFRKYNIKNVPAFVLAHHDQHDIVKGNVTARFALSKMKTSGDLKNHAEQRLSYAR